MEITKESAPTFLRNLQQNVDRLVIDKEQIFKINPLIFLEYGEHVTLIVKEYPIETMPRRMSCTLLINAEVYKNANDLFAQIGQIRMRQLPDYKVLMEVPESYEVEFENGLQNLLGFAKRRFPTGRYISSYPLDLHAGITEISVFLDIVMWEILTHPSSALYLVQTKNASKL